MSIRVKTITVCGMCDRTHEREGAEGQFPPVGWADVDLHIRAPGSGWSGGGERVAETVCPECAGKLKQLITTGETA